ncbi:MAG TPA: signal peptidase I, partial [Vicinamibacterales bacterium]|nr:signal peptidase I [Vicinamibacterales bacterium]
ICAQIPGTSARLPAFESPHRGDVIVFAYPKDPTITYVKRVIGVGNDIVEMRDGQTLVNGRAIQEPYVQRTDPMHDGFDAEFNWQRQYLARATDEQRSRYHPTRDTWGPLRVPRNMYLVLGDNRDNSADSRYWGFVDASAIKGRPLVVYFSYDRGTRDALPWLTDIRWSRLGSLIH